jgi:hypothetical protein
MQEAPITVLDEAQAYLQAEEVRLAASARALIYPDGKNASIVPISNERKQRLTQILKQQYGRDHSEDINHHAEDMQHWLRQLKADLCDDLTTALGSDYAPLLDRVALDFMPHLKSDAFITGLGEPPRTSWAVGINLGLVWVSNLVAEALLGAAQDQGAAAKDTYGAAHKVYQAQTQRQLDAAWQGMPSRSDELSLQAGGVGSVVLRFVALHEMGHAVLGHVGRWEMGVSDDSGERSYGAAERSDIPAIQAMEREADCFALERMIDISSGPDAMWNNLLFIAAYFRLLAQVEAQQGAPLCSYHPPPTQRIEYLYEILVQHMGPPTNDAWAWARQLQDDWMQ